MLHNGFISIVVELMSKDKLQFLKNILKNLGFVGILGVFGFGLNFVIQGG